MGYLLGSLLPGLVLCAAVARSVVDPTRIEAGAAALAVVLASVVGLLVQEAVRPWVAGAAPDAAGPWAPFAEKVRARFGVDAAADGERALQLARAALVTAGQGRDAEQSRTMQGLCRGLVGAFLLSAAWSVGTSTGTVPLWVAAPALLVAAFAVGRQSGTFDRMFDGGALLGLPAAALALALAGRIAAPVGTWREAAVAIAAALALVGLARVAAGAYERYTRRSADEVIRGFVVLPD